LCEIAPLKSVLLDPRSKAEAEDRVAAAEAILRNSQSKSMADAASAEFTRAEYKRIKSIFDKKMISRSELERIEAEKRRDAANLQSSRYAVDTARYTLEEARAALSHFATRGEEMSGERVAIHSPIEGQVLAVFHESGGVVQAGQVLMEVGDPQALEIVIELHSADAVRIQPGMRVLLEHWGGERDLEGSVRLIKPTGFTKVSTLGVEEQRVKVIVDIVSEQERWSRLGDGYRVDAKFILWEGNDILQIPANALFRYKSGWAVFIIGDNCRAEIQMVEPGKRSGLSTQILSGLNEGQKIVIHPEDTLEPGSKVKLSKSNSVNP
jgi:HlyD family secretion protein